MQLDADEDGDPFFKPPAISPAPIRQRDKPSGDEQQTAERSQEGMEGGTEQATAAIATIEQEE